MTPIVEQIYNLLLNNMLWSITPNLPPGVAGTRLPVGIPEHIPEVTFITRQVTLADGFFPRERDRLNGYIDDAIAFHNLYGLNPLIIGSLEEILDHFNTINTTIDRIRLVTHGSDEFIFMPMFRNGSWGYGITDERLAAFQTSNEQGVRYLLSGADPMVRNGLAVMVDGIRTINSAVLTPFGLNVSGMPAAGDMELFFHVVNDFWQVQHGMIMEAVPTQPPPPPPPPAPIPPDPPPTYRLINATQQGHYNTALNFLEGEIRGRLIGTTVGATTLSAAHLDAYKAAVLGASPTELGFLGPSENLSATVIADLGVAMAASPHVEADLRNAIAGHTMEPMWEDNLWGIIEGLKMLHPNVVELAGGALTITGTADLTTVNGLENYFQVCNDIFFLEHGEVTINGTAITPAERNTLRNGLRAIAALIAPTVTADPIGVTGAELTAIRTTIEGMSTREAALTGGWTYHIASGITDFDAAITAINNGFRAKLNHFRSIIRTTSTCDIRGCEVGAKASFLTNLRTFLGSSTDLPAISAPRWFQSFPVSVQYGGWGTPIFQDIDNIAAMAPGVPISPDISSGDITSSLSTWQGLIDFDPHYAFISDLFDDSNASRFDFATLEWRVWRVPPATAGIPILRMEAQRIDTLAGMNLEDIIERFRVIFEIASPTSNAARSPGMGSDVRTRLNNLQPHILAYKNVRTNVAALTGPSDPGLAALETSLTNLAGQISAIAGFPAPAGPLAPASASLTDIQTSSANIQTHIDNILTTDLDPFFAEVRTLLGHANAELRYFYNIGLPLLLQSSTRESVFHVTTYMSANSGGQRNTQTADAIRSWMRIQWTGSFVQAATMNAHITGLAIGNNAQRVAASRVAMLTNGDPQRTNPASLSAVISPMPGYHGEIVTVP